MLILCNEQFCTLIFYITALNAVEPWLIDGKVRNLIHKFLILTAFQSTFLLYVSILMTVHKSAPLHAIGNNYLRLDNFGN